MAKQQPKPATSVFLIVREPDLMRLVLQASVADLVNVQSVEAVDAELKPRAVGGN
jgi:hypothetical protein